MFNFRRMSNPISAEQSVCFVLIDFNGTTHRPVKSCVLCVTLSQLIPPCSALQHGLWSAFCKTLELLWTLWPCVTCVSLAVSGMWENGLVVSGNHVIYSEDLQANTNLILLYSLWSHAQVFCWVGLYHPNHLRRCLARVFLDPLGTPSWINIQYVLLMDRTSSAQEGSLEQNRWVPRAQIHSPVSPNLGA